MSITVVDFLAATLAEIRVARAGDVLAADDQDLALLLFNELLEALNAESRAVYSDAFTSYVLTPNLQPHTIGPSGTFTATQRPVTLEGANLVLTNVTPNIRVPLTLRDSAWWLNLRARGVTSSVPIDLYYQPTWPNGNLNLWPVPTTAHSLELETRVLLLSVAVGDTMNLPPGYQQALRLTLAELCASPFGQQVSQTTAAKAREARARIWGVNDTIPNLDTIDAGMPAGTRRGGFSFVTGTTVR